MNAQAYRDTRGPGLDAYKALVAVAQAQPGTKGLRDVALLRLLRDLGLRRGEAVRFCCHRASRTRCGVSAALTVAARCAAYLWVVATDDQSMRWNFVDCYPQCYPESILGTGAAL